MGQDRREGWNEMGWDGMGMDAAFLLYTSLAEEQHPHQGRIWPLQGLWDANFSQNQRITAHQLQSILCRGRKQRKKRNKKRFLICRGFGTSVVFGGRRGKKA